MPDRLTDISQLPYRVAVLAYLYDADDRVLLLHRTRSPNKGLYSPIGGKLEVAIGEGPHQCAIREIEEESGVIVKDCDVHLMAVVSEAAYEGKNHWLLFLFEVTRPVKLEEIQPVDMDEGTLEWVSLDAIYDKPLPETDRRFMWDLVAKHRHGGFFMMHIDCTGEEMRWSLQESVLPEQVV